MGTFSETDIKKEFEEISESSGEMKINLMEMIEIKLAYKAKNFIDKNGVTAYCDLMPKDIVYTTGDEDTDNFLGKIGKFQVMGLKEKHIYYFLSKGEKDIITMPSEDSGTYEMNDVVLNGVKEDQFNPNFEKLYKSHQEVAEKHGANKDREYLEKNIEKLPQKAMDAQKKLLDEFMSAIFDGSSYFNLLE